MSLEKKKYDSSRTTSPEKVMEVMEGFELPLGPNVSNRHMSTAHRLHNKSIALPPQPLPLPLPSQVMTPSSHASQSHEHSPIQTLPNMTYRQASWSEERRSQSRESHSETRSRHRSREYEQQGQSNNNTNCSRGIVPHTRLMLESPTKSQFCFDNNSSTNQNNILIVESFPSSHATINDGNSRLYEIPNDTTNSNYTTNINNNNNLNNVQVSHQPLENSSTTNNNNNNTISSSSTTTLPDHKLISKDDFLQRNSFEFMLYVICLTIAMFQVFGVDLAFASQEFYDELNVNLHPPWFIFRWLGSRGVDVTDVQWYVFVSALPFALPVLMLFIFVSHQLRRRRGSLVETVIIIPTPSTITVNSSNDNNSTNNDLNSANTKKINNSSRNSNGFTNEYMLSNGNKKEEKSEQNGLRHPEEDHYSNGIATSQNYTGNSNYKDGVLNSSCSKTNINSANSSATHTVNGVKESNARKVSLSMNEQDVSSNEPHSSVLINGISQNGHKDAINNINTERNVMHKNTVAPFVASSSNTTATNIDTPSTSFRIKHTYRKLQWLHLIVGLCIAFGLSGPGFLFGFALIVFNYFVIAQLYKIFSFRVCMTIMWSWNVMMLFLNFHAHGYRFAWIGLAALDSFYSPPLIVWQVHYNMSVLRMIAFNNDMWEASKDGTRIRAKVNESHQSSCVECAAIRLNSTVQMNSSDESKSESSVSMSQNNSSTSGNSKTSQINYNNNSEKNGSNSNTVNGFHVEQTIHQVHHHHHHNNKEKIKANGSVSIHVHHVQNETSTFNKSKNKHTEALSCYKCRTYCPREISEYNLLSYLAYIYYPPLFVAGPMSSFNAYVSYLHYPQRAVRGKDLKKYGLKVLGNALFLSAMMHYIYIMALLLTKPPVPSTSTSSTTSTLIPVNDNGDNNNNNVAQTFSTAEVLPIILPVVERLTFNRKCALTFMTLAFLWSKFNVIWKVSRLFALLDGFDPPEDMRRCFGNTVNIQGFWRDWHASFNLWIVRYMYIPMGGNKTKFISIFPIFVFIAIWHDIELRLLFWAGFIIIGFVPEMIITSYVAKTRNKHILRLKSHTLLWRHVRMFGAWLGMLELMTINLIGFTIGEDGAFTTIKNLSVYFLTRQGFLVGFYFYCAAGIAIQDRDQEKYNNQQLRLKYHLPIR